MGISFKDRVKTALGVIIPSFGELITYEYCQQGGSTLLKSVFDREYASIDPDTNAIISSTMPRFGVRLSDLTAIPQPGDNISTSTGERFTVTSIEEDGQGHAYIYAKTKRGLRDAQ